MTPNAPSGWSRRVMRLKRPSCIVRLLNFNRQPSASRNQIAFRRKGTRFHATGARAEIPVQTATKRLSPEPFEDTGREPPAECHHQADEGTHSQAMSARAVFNFCRVADP